MLWKLNMDPMATNLFDSTRNYNPKNDKNTNFENILDTSIMIDPRKSMYFKTTPEDFEIENAE